MGIEAFCRNGHRIKVKDSYAGKKVYCPTCGAKLRVPRVPNAADDDALPTAKLLNLDPQFVATLPRALPAE
jgi:hypothetical protein